ncbi:MAG: hypothetical protein IKD12_06740, partial [Paludibacteraceae bacterium]|nr:hypothetical protein [Paludibacteraceae bacterium]
MQKVIRNILFVLVVLLFAACKSGDASSLEQKRLAERQAQAEQQTAALCEALQHNASLDSIRLIAERNEDVLFYVFDARQMVYWSSNRLASDAIYLTAYDTWRDQTFSNAQT